MSGGPRRAARGGRRQRTGSGGRVRIIGGRWRRRILLFPERPELRPTPDRVRETLFNWLDPYLEGARCLDLFAGSGALGFEAASRGAAEVVMLERDAVLVTRLREHARSLAAERIVRIEGADALQWLRGSARPFDIVFVDPPFGEPVRTRICTLLSAGGWLAEGALVYVEASAAGEPEPLPPGWCPLRSGRAGRVRYDLVTSCAG